MTESTPKLSADLVAQLNEHGVPAETHKFFPKGLGELIPRMGIIFSELTAERAVASMSVQGNTSLSVCSTEVPRLFLQKLLVH